MTYQEHLDALLVSRDRVSPGMLQRRLRLSRAAALEHIATLQREGRIVADCEGESFKVVR